MSQAVLTLARRHPWMSIALGAVLLVLLLLVAGEAIARTPWGAALTAWIAVQQQGLYRLLSGAVSALRDEGSLAAFATLLGLAFAYGVFHALGPGHGKAVVSAYMLASGETVRRGIVVSLLASLAQGLTAVVAVGTLVVLIGMTARAATAELAILEQLSFAGIAAVGLWILVREAHGLLKARDEAHIRPHVGHGAAHDHDHTHHHHGSACGHDHAAEAALARQKLSWALVPAVVMSVGLRPCMGAILVLVFTFGLGLYVQGILAVAVMSLGTGATVAAIAGLTAAARGAGLRRLLGDSPWFAVAHRAVAVAGGLALLLLGLTLLTAPAAAPSPFGPMPLT